MASLRLAVDAMGGDFGLRSTIPASILALNENSELHITLVGDEPAIRAALADSRAPLDRLSIVHAPDVVLMEDKPASALRTKRQSSMAIALELLRDGQVSAVLSAGNTGALVAMSCIIVQRMDGIRRPAICAPIPSDHHHTFMLDLGANVECSAEELRQYAVMGSALCSVVDGNAQPRVGLLNIGEELIKGTALMQDTAALLNEEPRLNYVGFVEGGDIFGSEVDVVVCDGFVGNIALKVSEGTASFINRTLRAQLRETLLGRLVGLLLLPVLKRFQKRHDPRHYNGAVLLGLKGVVVKSHGSSDEKGFLAAIQQAARAVGQDLPARIAEHL